ncbi:hypothetical protein N0V93_008571 [Gnomoniopsis smithogilvyi]|uniref:Uncharacterized protein n=1 Tax=Gnomoniopsis smithogilvyi TaxID=1191159 RepID=A0A9W8YPF0_9PEZI|nr:hypothetical protein N0V93_008571 [Gnomoniopsis smithogilvyi]
MPVVDTLRLPDGATEPVLGLGDSHVPCVEEPVIDKGIDDGPPIVDSDGLSGVKDGPPLAPEDINSEVETSDFDAAGLVNPEGNNESEEDDGRLGVPGMAVDDKTPLFVEIGVSQPVAPVELGREDECVLGPAGAPDSLLEYIPEPASADVLRMLLDTLEEGPDDSVPEGVEVAGRLADEVKFHDRILGRATDDGEPELATLDEGKSEDAKLEDGGPDAEVLDGSVSPLVAEIEIEALNDRTPGGVELKRLLEDGKPEEGKLDTG